MDTFVLIPAYGRDYRSKKQAFADLVNDKDFMIASMHGGGYVTLSELIEHGFDSWPLEVRYNKLRNLFFVERCHQCFIFYHGETCWSCN